MIDLREARALAEAARADTSEGLEAREKLPDVVDALLAEVKRAYSLRLERPSAAVDPEVHTPQRVRAYLAAGGWEVAEGGRVAELWRLAAVHDRQVTVPLIPTAPDYAKVLGMLATDLAKRYSVGELRVLAEIAACDG
jgi:hypothetical protein